MNHRSLPSLVLSVTVVALGGCADDRLDDGGAGLGGQYGGATSAGAGGGGPKDVPVESADMTTGASGTSSSGGAMVDLTQICGEDLPAPEKLELSFHGHPSTAGAQYARATLLRAVPILPDPTLLQAEDFLSFYGLDATTAVNKQVGPLEVRWYPTGKSDLSTSAMLEIDYVAPPDQRDAFRLVVLVDVSQSLAQGLGLAHDAVRAMARGMAGGAMPGDTMAVMTFAGDVTTEIDGAVQGGQAYGGLPIDSLALGVRSGNDFSGAVRDSIKAAQNGATPAHVVVLTDGGTTVEAPLLEEVRAAAANGVRLSVAQVAIDLPSGPAPLARTFLEQLASAGRGGRFYLAQVSDADRAFDARFGSSFGVYARAAKATIELPALLSTVGLATAPLGSTEGPAGGLIGADAVHPLRIGLEAACPAVFSSDISGLTIDIGLAGGVGGMAGTLGSVSGDWLVHRGPSELTMRNDAILAVAQALRSRSSDDIDLAQDALSAVKAGDCLECERVDELQAMLDAVQ